MKRKIKSVQEWLPFEEILSKGIIKLKNNKFVKVIKIVPINYSLKSELEKEAILNSYKTFLKTCNFDMQILIQSNKQDLSKHIFKVKQQIEKENPNIKEISNNYINYIQRKNNEKKSTSKNFFVLIKNSNYNEIETTIEELNEKYFKIKEGLSKCGNQVIEIEKKEEIKQILYSFFGSEIYTKNKEGEKC